MKLQNGTFNNKNYVKVPSLNVGRSVIPEWENGDVTFGSGSVFTFQVGGDVLLNSGLVLSNGSEVKIIADGDVTINDIVVMPGASLEIECAKCTIFNTEVPESAILSIKER